MGSVMKEQLGNQRAMYVTSAILLVMGIVPGMPHLAFLGFSAAIGGYTYWQQKREGQAKLAAVEETPAEQTAKPVEVKELGWDDVQQVDTIGLYGLSFDPLVDKSQGGELLQRIKACVRNYLKSWVS